MNRQPSYHRGHAQEHPSQRCKLRLPGASESSRIPHGTFDVDQLDGGYATILCLRHPGDAGYRRSSWFESESCGEPNPNSRSEPPAEYREDPMAARSRWVIGIVTAGKPSPHFSPRGETKCVRGASVRGARRLTSGGVLRQYVEHGEQAQRSTGGPIACFDRQVVRNEG